MTRKNKVWFLKNRGSAWVLLAISEKTFNLSLLCFCTCFPLLATFFVKDSVTEPNRYFSALLLFSLGGLGHHWPLSFSWRPPLLLAAVQTAHLPGSPLLTFFSFPGVLGLLKA